MNGWSVYFSIGVLVWLYITLPEGELKGEDLFVGAALVFAWPVFMAAIMLGDGFEQKVLLKWDWPWKEDDNDISD